MLHRSLPGNRSLYKILISGLVLWLLFVLVRALVRQFTRPYRRGYLLEGADIDVILSKDPNAAQSLHTVSSLKARVGPLKRNREYGPLGEVYASLNQHKQAAKYLKKAGRDRRAAEEWAKAGLPIKAAKLLLKEGDFSGAAHFFAAAERHVDAAKAYEKGGDLAKAAAAYTLAGKYGEAMAAYSEYFAHPKEPMEEQLKAAEACLALLRSEAGRANIPAETRAPLLPPLAACFEHGQRYEQAAALWCMAGDMVRAGEVFVLAGKLEEAADCLRKAGRDKEASQIAGRFYEKKGQWREAGQAFVTAGDFLRAGECYAKATEPARSGECFEKGGDHYRAGLGYAHAGRFSDAIRVLQRLRESEANFDVSRALLGRCFYELHDYEHCAATLDNHLTGKRVETANIEYFYMLALAFEQLGKLAPSKEILLKIHAVQMAYRDVTERISSISSRISMQVVGVRATPAPETAAREANLAETQVMQTVETALGGRYQLERELGRGGMGVVYLAKDIQLDRLVALKFLGTLIDDSEEYRQRFVREARTAARINHPNIIAIYDISASLGKAYIAMEYVEGPNLARYLSKKGRLEPREAVNIIAQACSAIAAVHEAGITHRDIKPDNLLVSKGGLIKLTDFGLAKAADARMTQAGTVMGTPSYMSPEQALGKDADGRSDIYSTGLVLHEVLTGNTVFRDGNVVQRQINEVPPPPSASTQGIPEKLDALVMKCIAKKPEERYQTVRELLADLRKVFS
jgi:tetratricopeptide (TPR) repeat protein